MPSAARRVVRDLPVRQIEVDEIWTYIHTKQRHLGPGASADHGDIYLYLAEDVVSRAIIVAELGKRNSATTERFISELRSRILGRPHITSDGHKPYLAAIRKAFGTDVDYAQIDKQYESVRLPNGKLVADVFVKSVRTVKIGAPNLRLATTSHVERLNGTLRERSSKFVRDSRHHAKSRPHLEAEVFLLIADYNFVTAHSTLRRTPAEALELTDHAWSLAELVDAALAEPNEAEVAGVVDPRAVELAVTTDGLR